MEVVLVKNDRFKAAREAKALKAAIRAGEKDIKIPATVDKNKFGPDYVSWDDKDVWLRGFLLGLRNQDIRSAVHVNSAVPFADAVLEEYKKKFK